MPPTEQALKFWIRCQARSFDIQRWKRGIYEVLLHKHPCSSPPALKCSSRLKWGFCIPLLWWSEVRCEACSSLRGALRQWHLSPEPWMPTEFHLIWNLWVCAAITGSAQAKQLLHLLLQKHVGLLTKRKKIASARSLSKP